MADLRIVDAPSLPQELITDDVKLPTGGVGNYSITLADLAWYVVSDSNLVDKIYIDDIDATLQASLTAHIDDKANPHQVTKEQLGLGNVDNTADLDKPVSDATASAIITATTDMATKTYVNQQDGLKADKVDTYSKSDVDTKVASISGGYIGAFATLTELQAKTGMTTGQVAKVMNNGVNSGDYYYNGTVWVKGYSPTDDAKAYFDNNVTITNTSQLYNSANNAVNINVNPDTGALRTVSTAQVAIFAIKKNVRYTLTSPNFNTTYAALSVSATSDATVGKAQTLVALTATSDANVKTFIAPIDGFAFLNVKWSTSLDISTTLTIKSSEFDVVTKVKGANIYDALAQKRLDDAEIETVINDSDLTVVYPNLYTNAQKTSGYYVASSGILYANAGAELVAIPILPNKTYYIKSDKFMSSKIVGLSDTSTVSASKPVTNVTLTATNDATVYSFTTDSNTANKFAFFTTRLDSQTYDVRSTLQVFVDKVPTDTTPYLSKINGMRINDTAQTVKSRLQDKKIFALGDSITQGTNGGYVQYLEQAFGTVINNYGSSGGRASRVVDIVTAGEGLPKRDSATVDTAWAVKDFSNLACVTLMIGTNDSDGSVESLGDVSQIPTAKISDYANKNDYWSLFPNNYVCNIALTIEFLRWKSNNVEIHICTPPYRNQDGTDIGRITKLIPLLESVCRHYGVHLIYGTYENGIGYKMMSSSYPYSYDGVHFTALGNEVFGKFFAQKVLSFG